MVQAGANSRLTAILLTIAGVVAWASALTVAGLLKPADLAAGVRYLGMATLVASGVAVALNRYLWRKPVGRALLHIPDLSGRWEGWTFRSFTGEWRPSAQEITQHALDIAANAWGPDNWARGICASIVNDRLGGACELVWSYKTEPTTPNYHAGDAHSGTHFLRLSERDGHKFLEGRYVTDRVNAEGRMGTGGFIQLVWVSSSLKTALAYNEPEWPIPRPANAPVIAVAPPNSPHAP